MNKSLLIAAIVIAGVLSIAGGPIAWAVVVMIGVPFALLLAVKSAGHANEDNPHFASTHSRPNPTARG